MSKKLMTNKQTNKLHHFYEDYCFNYIILLLTLSYLKSIFYTCFNSYFYYYNPKLEYFTNTQQRYSNE